MGAKRVNLMKFARQFSFGTGGVDSIVANLVEFFPLLAAMPDGAGCGGPRAEWAFGKEGRSDRGSLWLVSFGQIRCGRNRPKRKEQANGF